MHTDPQRAAAELDRAERELRSAGRAATADRDRLALRVRAEPENEILAEDLAAVEAELAGYRRDLERVAASRRALQEQVAADTVERRQAVLDAARVEVLAAASDRLKAAAAVEKSLAALGVALAAETAAATRGCNAARQAAALMSGDSHGVGAVVGSVRGAFVSAAPILSRLNAAMAGHAMQPFVEITAFTDPQPPIQQAAEIGVARLKSQVANWSLPSAEPVVIDEFAPGVSA